MEALWLAVSDRGSRSVLDCVADAMQEFGHPLTVPKSKKSKAKAKAKGKSDGGGVDFADMFGGGNGDFGDDNDFEEFLKAAFVGGGRGGAAKPRSQPSWFFDFDMDDDEYF